MMTSLSGLARIAYEEALVALFPSFDMDVAILPKFSMTAAIVKFFEPVTEHEVDDLIKGVEGATCISCGCSAQAANTLVRSFETNVRFGDSDDSSIDTQFWLPFPKCAAEILIDLGDVPPAF